MSGGQHKRPEDAPGGAGDDAEGAASEVVDAELLSDVEGEYVDRWLAHDRAQRDAGRSGERSGVATSAAPAVDPAAPPAGPRLSSGVSPSAVIARRRDAALAPRRTELARRAGAATVAGRQWVAGRVVTPTVAVWRSDPARQARSAAAYRLRNSPRDLLRLARFVVRGNGRWVVKAWGPTSPTPTCARTRVPRVWPGTWTPAAPRRS
jgi:hypothetical protein